MKPRWYQQKMVNQCHDAINNGYKGVCVVAPPRSGKTPTAYWIAEPYIKSQNPFMFFAHREELVTQLSMTFAEFGVTHQVIAPSDVISSIIKKQFSKFKRSYVDNRSYNVIGSVQTIVSRLDRLKTLLLRMQIIMCDEAHHCLPDNQWGKVITACPNAVLVGFTATPGRTDRKSLAKSENGLFDYLVKTVNARQLIDEGHICDYRIVAPPSSIKREDIKVGTTGDFTKKSLSDAKRHSTITGDCVQSYLKYTPGQQAIVFAVDIAHATDLKQSFVEAGVTAEMVSGKTNKSLRKGLMDKFTRKQYNVLINVDLFGEGLNVVGIDVVIMARPTQSYVLYTQQFFRALTKGGGKDVGTIIDHAGNVAYFGKIYGLPDVYNGWQLEVGKRNSKSQSFEDDEHMVKVITCPECFNPYDKLEVSCPYCGHIPVPENRSGPEHVEGDLVLLDEKALAELRAVSMRITGQPLVPEKLKGTVAELGLRKTWAQRHEAQIDLRNSMAFWSGYWHERGESDRKIQKRFYDRFGIDVLTAQGLKKKDADKLKIEVDNSLNKLMQS